MPLVPLFTHRTIANGFLADRDGKIEIIGDNGKQIGTVHPNAVRRYKSTWLPVQPSLSRLLQCTWGWITAAESDAIRRGEA